MHYYLPLVKSIFTSYGYIYNKYYHSVINNIKYNVFMMLNDQ